MLTQLGASLVGLFDSIMVGRYATVDLAAVSFSNALFFTVMVFAMGALMGLTPLVGIQMGRLASNNESHLTSDSELSDGKSIITSLFQNGMLFTVLLGVFTLVLLGGCIPFLHCFGQDPEVVEAAKPYYILIVISIVPFLFFTFFKQFDCNLTVVGYDERPYSELIRTDRYDDKSCDFRIDNRTSGRHRIGC